MSGTFKAACVQTNSGPEIGPNVEAVGGLIRQARAEGADLVMLPEVVNMIEPDRERRWRKAVRAAEDPALAAFRALAAEIGVWILVGSLSVRGRGRKIANRSFLLDDAGRIVARYDKIHMFDVDIAPTESHRESKTVHRESKTVHAGATAVVADTPWGRLGLSVCYDVRFPHLYRALAQRGARYLSVPSAFTRPTGRDHWHVLLRARAIENGCYVFAPAQCGEHAGGRLTYGHSLIVDPWGEVLADGGEDVGIIAAEIDQRPGGVDGPSRARVDDVRGRLPSITHDRPFA